MAQKKSEGTVTVALRRSFGYQGKYYGPGSAVEVPEGLASSLALQPVKASASKEASGDELPTVSELADALKGKSAKDIKAMQKKDDRVSAGPIYDKALESAK